MFKKSIIALLCCAAYLCCAMELAEKHLVDLQARCAFGEEDPVMALNAEADLLAVKLALKLSSEGGITSEEQIEANRRNAAIVCQTYEKMAAEQQVSPSILRQARLDYLLAQRCVEKMGK